MLQTWPSGLCNLSDNSLRWLIEGIGPPREALWRTNRQAGERCVHLLASQAAPVLAGSERLLDWEMVAWAHPGLPAQEPWASARMVLLAER